MKDFFIRIGSIAGIILAFATLIWVFLFCIGVIVNVVALPPNPLFLADCLTNQDELKREFSCRMAWNEKRN